MSLLDVRGVGKSYRRYTSEIQRVLRWLNLPVGTVEENWVLEDVSFSVQQGDAIGIVGRNGAGKSTLLKIIAGSMAPTTGSVHVSGRVSAILELGMGFSPEMTGRQNAYHALGLMGFSKREVDSVISDIEAFAEIGHYFDEPVRTYSSGMQMRVAFSVATAFRPEILIVDEALSVGDTYFQHRSFDRIRQFQEQGTSLLLVSHDRTAIQSLCSRAVLIQDGKVLLVASPVDVFDTYMALLPDMERHGPAKHVQGLPGAIAESGSREAEYIGVTLVGDSGVETDLVRVGERVTVALKVRVNEDLTSLVAGFGVRDRLGQMMFTTNTYHTGQMIRNPCRGDEFLIEVDFFANLGVGSYSVHCSLIEELSHVDKNYHWVERAMVFSVYNADKPEFGGCQWNAMTFKITGGQA